MNTLKGWIATTCLAATIILSTIPVHAGIIFGGNLNQPVNTPCTDTRIEKVSVPTSENLVGIIFGGLVGIIFGGGSVTDGNENCGIIFGGN